MIKQKMNMLTGNPIQISSTLTIVTTSMIKNVAPTALHASGRGPLETLEAGSQRMQLVAARPKRPSFGVQAVLISLMDSAGLFAKIVAKLASLMILPAIRKHAAARPGDDP